MNENKLTEIFSFFKDKYIQHTSENKAGDKRLPSRFPALPQAPTSPSLPPLLTFEVQLRLSPFSLHSRSTQDWHTHSSSHGASAAQAFKDPPGEPALLCSQPASPSSISNCSTSPQQMPIPLFSLTGPTATLTSAKR